MIKKNKNIKSIWKKRYTLIKFLILNSLLFLLIIIFINHNNHNNLKNFLRDEITLVTCLYQIETKRHKFSDYLNWVDNILQINKPIVFYVQPNLSEIIKNKRPQIFKNKTIWIEKEFSSFYSYIHYLKQFKETFLIDRATYKHSVDLYVLWSEKVNFLKESIENNYFKTKYFFWADAGLFRNNNMKKYINDWPSIEIIKKDPRVHLNGIRKISDQELTNLMNFDPKTHAKFMNNYNVAGNFFGGRGDNILKFIKYYYEILELFYKHKIYIGTDQNIFTIVGRLHPEIATIINSGNYEFLKNYFVLKKK